VGGCHATGKILGGREEKEVRGDEGALNFAFYTRNRTWRFPAAALLLLLLLATPPTHPRIYDFYSPTRSLHYFPRLALLFLPQRTDKFHGRALPVASPRDSGFMHEMPVSRDWVFRIIFQVGVLPFRPPPLPPPPLPWLAVIQRYALQTFQKQCSCKPLHSNFIRLIDQERATLNSFFHNRCRRFDLPIALRPLIRPIYTSNSTSRLFGLIFFFVFVFFSFKRRECRATRRRSA
jgi:hypothetical protein